MQATLLGVGIAIILALLAALVGPYFVDWDQYRAVFEAQSSRLIGVPVRVAGSIDARILPAPSLLLRQVEVGEAAGENPPLRARELSVELALGPLLHGVWQAADLRLTGLELRLGLDPNGQVAWPVALEGLDPERISVRRLEIADGRVTLSDQASGGSFTVSALAFTGEVRSLAGPVKGDGSFALDGRPYEFQIAAGRLDENDAMKLHVALDPVDRPLAIETDGTLGFSSGVPEFDGTLTLVRLAGAVDASGRGAAFVPWRATGQIKASPTNALIPQGEFQYGPAERAVKLAGTANIKFGKSPRFDAVISGQQLNLDAVMDLPEPIRRLPVAAAGRLVENFVGPFRLPMPGQVGIAIDAVTLAGSSIQDVRGDLASTARGWDLETFEFRAPGLTHVRTSGRLAAGPDGATFDGAATIEATDPKALVSWLEARPLGPQGQAGIFRASGDVAIGPDHVAIERLRAEIDQKTIEGRLDYTVAADGRPSRLKASLKAASIDVDQVAGFAAAAFAGTGIELPAELAVTADVDQATIAGVEAKNSHVKLALGAKGLVLDRFSIADLGGTAIEATGRLDALRSAPRGTLNLDFDGQRLGAVTALLAKLGPGIADAIQPLSSRLAPLRARAILTMSGAQGAADETVSKLDVRGSAGRMRVQLSSEATGSPWNVGALVLKLNGQVAADNGSELVALGGLDGFVSPDKGPATLTVAAQGPIGGDLHADAWLSAGGLSASADGRVRLVGEDGPNAGLALKVWAADLGPVLRAAAGPGSPKLAVALTSRVAATRGKVSLEDLAGTFAGTPIRGRFDVAFDPALRVDGHIDVDDMAVPALLSAAIGAPQRTPANNASGGPSVEPFTQGLFSKFIAHIEFGAARATLTPALVARNAHGMVRMEGSEFAAEHVEADLAGGHVGCDVTFRQSPDAMNVKARFALSKVDAVAILPAGDRLGVNGRLTLDTEVQGAGRSPATLMASLSGVGTVSLDQGRLARLDPKAFDTAIRAVDQGLAIVPGKILGVVGPALDAGDLAIPHADAALTVASGQVRLINAIAHGEGADLAITGHVDPSNLAVDAQLTLTGPAIGPSLRPDIFLALGGSAASASRTIDVSAFANWLLLRSLDREVGRVEVLQAGTREPPTGSTDQKSAPAAATAVPTGSADRKNVPAAAAAVPTDRKNVPATAAASPTGSVDQKNAPAPAGAPTGPVDQKSAPAAAPQIGLAPGPDSLRPAPSSSGPPAVDQPGGADNPMRPGEQAPTLPPAIEVGPAPGAERAQARSRRTAIPERSVPQDGAAQKGPPLESPTEIGPPAASRSIFEPLFGPQR